MSIEEFLEKLKSVKDKYNWVVYYNKFVGAKIIRTINKEKDIITSYYSRCPITAINEPEFRYLSRARSCGLEMGLSETDIRKIIKASDGIIGYDKDLRNQMLEILGLEE
jgi:hypothetical protein